MNRDRRKQIGAEQDRLRALLTDLEEVKDALESLRDEEQDAYDNLPESIQEGEKGEKAQEAITYLDETISSLDDLLDSDALSNLDEAMA